MIADRTMTAHDVLDALVVLGESGVEEHDLRDMALLRDRLGVDVPPPY